MIRIGLTQRVETVPRRGERRDCLDQAWSVLLRACGWWPVPLPNRVEQVSELLDALKLSGVILTGGNDLAQVAPGNAAAERDLFERRLLDCCGARRIPVLGVCRGLQLMVTTAGGRLRRVSGHVGTRHPLRPGSEPRMPLTGMHEVNSYHCFGVDPDQLGKGLRPAALAADGTVEAVVHEHWPQWGIMWHPERESDPRAGGRMVQALLQGVDS